MADADGRRNSGRDGRRRTSRSTKDPRSAERARRVPRRTAGSRPAISVIETGEQELHLDDIDLVDDINPNDINANGVNPGGIGSDDIGSGGIDANEMDPDQDDRDVDEAGTDSHRVRVGRGERTPRRRAGIAESLLIRVRGLDAKRAVVMALVVGVVALALAPSLRNYYAGRAEYNQIVASNAQLTDEVATYQQKVNEQGDPAYKEAQARERLQMLRPGETGVVMMFPGDAQKQAELEAKAQREHNPWYGNLWESVANPPESR